jgi:hypothetical protein
LGLGSFFEALPVNYCWGLLQPEKNEKKKKKNVNYHDWFPLAEDIWSNNCLIANEKIMR